VFYALGVPLGRSAATVHTAWPLWPHYLSIHRPHLAHDVWQWQSGWSPLCLGPSHRWDLAVFRRKL